MICIDNYVNFTGFALPEKAKIESKVQAQNSKNYSNAIKFTTLGSPKIWRVSPVVMALSAAKLFSLNNTLNGTFLINQQMKESKFNIDSTSEKIKWPGIAEYFNFVKTNIYEPMSHVVSKGTLHTLVELKAGNYFLYAKTGTLGEGDQQNEDKLLILVISKGRVEYFQTLDQLRSNKFWVVYFSLPKGERDFRKTVGDIFNKVLDSDAFKKYMQQ
ncbi:MAG: hypothetical protein IPF62_10955 [Bacteroidetes bacterium]|nr:hypothetical protein [Bacteroidota bacterium]